MVCPRCVMVVEQIFKEHRVPFKTIQLGKVKLKNKIDKSQKTKLSHTLQNVGFAIVESAKMKIAEQIKAVIIEHLYFNNNPKKIKISALISKQLDYNYNYLSRVFSEVEGISIARFMQLQKIEKVIELFISNNWSLEKIAHELNYSSVSHLCSQSLEEVITHYSSGGKQHINKDKTITNFEISDTQKENLIHFLDSLTDSSFISKNWIK